MDLNSQRGTALYVIDTLTHTIVGGYFSENWDSS